MPSHPPPTTHHQGSRLGAYTELGVGARSAAADARRAGLAAVRHSRLARAANAQAMEALEPLHDELAMSPVRAAAAAARRRLPGMGARLAGNDEAAGLLLAQPRPPLLPPTCRRWLPRCASARPRC